MSGSQSDEQVTRNLEGIELEKTGDVDRATLLYEKNIGELTDTPHPYDRLSLIYHRQGKHEEALRVIGLFFKHAVQNPAVSRRLQKRKDRILKELGAEGETQMKFADRTSEIQIHRGAARKYRSQGDHALARASFLRWVESVRQQNINTGGQLDRELEDAKAEYSEFVRTDPLYQEICAAASPVIKGHPGILQTDLYKALQQYNRSDITYAMYFASEHGMVIRTKKGRTYSLTVAGGMSGRRAEP